MNLSPEPEKLISQQFDALTRQFIGQKRQAPTQIQSIFEDLVAGESSIKRAKIADPPEVIEPFNDMDVSEVIQNLLRERELAYAAQVPEVFDDGVKLGGYRQASYSDSH